MNPLTILFIKIVPKNLLSFLVGIVVSIRIPILGNWAARIFAKHFKINLKEAEKDISQYKSIQDLFTRKLKAGIRPIQGKLVHPCDSEITQSEVLQNFSLIQAKGKTYSLETLLQKNNIEHFKAGKFITYYLCPTDYHRVHSPISGTITGIDYIKGKLWPVNPWSVENIEDLFAINERLIFYIENQDTKAALVMVGATNVGKMTSPFINNFSTNQFGPKKSFANLNFEVSVGDEVGCFNMGSTVVMIYDNNTAGQLAVQPGKVKLGEKLI